MTIKRNIAAGTMLLLLMLAPGCTPNDIAIGSTVRHNSEVQIVDPDPAYTKAQTADGSQVAGAQTRYRTDQVKKAETIRTTSGRGSGSGSGSGSGLGSSGGN